MSNYKSYVFCFSTGRAGTGYLASILNGHHEPRFNDYALMRQVCKNNDILKAYNYIIDRKLPAIEKTFDESKDAYIETSHMLCKGFLVPLYNILKGKFKIIRLRRDKEKIVQSLIDLRNYFIYPDYGLEATDKFAIYRMKKQEWNKLDLENKISWYVDETERQWGRFSKTIPSSQQIELDVEYLNSIGSFACANLSSFTETQLNIENIGKPQNTSEILLKNRM